jgi:hypothetical protein
MLKKGQIHPATGGVKANEDLEVEPEWLLQQINIKAYFKFSQSSVLGSQKTQAVRTENVRTAFLFEAPEHRIGVENGRQALEILLGVVTVA